MLPNETTDRPDAERPPRLVVNRPFPPYTHVPGVTRHPIGDPAGHSFGHAHAACEPPDPVDWRACEAYLWGVDLFNAGYYWEAHEAWESVWIAAGRTGSTADFLKALIKLAAAGVKLREQNPAGARRHLRRAVELLGAVCVSDAGAARAFGLLIETLRSAAVEQLSCGWESELPRDGQPRAILRITLRPE